MGGNGEGRERMWGVDGGGARVLGGGGYRGVDRGGVLGLVMVRVV